MYSRSIELAGLTLISLGIAGLLGPWAGVLTGGLALLVVGGTTDDGEVRRALRRGVNWARYLYHRQVLREGLGERSSPPSDRSPHPAITLDPEMEALAERLAAERVRRGDGRMTEVLP